MNEQHLKEAENMLFELKHAMVPQDMETTSAHGKRIDALEYVIKQAKQSKKYRTVIRHLENAYQDMSDDETIGQDDWLGGWAAAVDFIEENIDWEESDEAKTIVEENKELSDCVRELENLVKCERNIAGKAQSRADKLEKENKRYREAMQEAKEMASCCGMTAVSILDEALEGEE